MTTMMSRSFATQSSVSPRRSVIPKHNAREASQGYLPASCSELVAVLADYLLWRFGKDGIAAVEHQAKALQVLELESILSYQNSRRELGQIPTALKIRFRGTKGHPLEPQSSSEIDPKQKLTALALPAAHGRPVGVAGAYPQLKLKAARHAFRTTPTVKASDLAEQT